jgi:cell division protein ZipA
MGIRDWLAIIVIIFIVLILLDGFRRKWQERKTRIRVKLDKNIPPDDGQDDNEILTKSELPNGGARIKTRAGGEVPVLMDSVDIDSEDIEEYADSDDDDDAGGDEDWEDDWDDDEPVQAEAEDLDDEMDDEDLAIDQSGDLDTVDEDDFELPDLDDDGEPWTATDDFDDDGIGKTKVVSRQPESRKSRDSGERIEPTFGDADMTFGRDDQGELDLEHNDLVDHEDEGETEDDAGQGVAAQVIIINVMAKPGAEMAGSRMLPVLMKHGMRLGDMSIFHRHADNSGKGPVMFSMANMLKPGTFSMSDMDTFTTPGVSFFMQLPNKLGNMQCFDQMLKTAQAVKEELDAILKDENRSVFTRQTIEHSRQRIRDFELEMLARK